MLGKHWTIYPTMYVFQSADTHFGAPTPLLYGIAAALLGLAW